MKITYSPLWHMLAEKNIKKSTFRNDINLNMHTYNRMRNGEYITLTTLIRICEHYDCQVEDVIQLSN